MIKVKSPATSANLGPGFDIMGLALTLYNTFYVELSDELIIENTNISFQNEDNLFYKGFKLVADYVKSNKKCHVIYDKIDIPFCRGLGSSSSLICAGAISANELLNCNLPLDIIYNLCAELEGHPDNVGASIYGGLTYNMKSHEKYYKNTIKISDDIHICVIIPNYQISTIEARKVIKQNVNLSDAIFNISHSLFLIDALKEGDFDKLKISYDDTLHVPYRKNLIENYEDIKDECIKKGASLFTISGSGSTMIVFSKNSNFSKLIDLDSNYKVLDLNVDYKGTKIE